MKSLIESALSVCDYIPHMEQADEAQIAPLLIAPESSLRRLVGEQAYTTLIEDSSVLAAVQVAARRYIFARGLADGLPSLDLVLTSNGFGVVSNENYAPASRERVQALRTSLYAMASEAYADFVDAYLPVLDSLPTTCLLASRAASDAFLHAREYRFSGGKMDFELVRSDVNALMTQQLRPQLGDELLSSVLLASRRVGIKSGHELLKRQLVSVVECATSKTFTLSVFDPLFVYLESHLEDYPLFASCPYARRRAASVPPSVPGRTFFGGL